MFGACHQLFITFSIMLTTVIGMFLKVEDTAEKQRENWQWRFAYGGSIVFVFFQVLLLVLVYKDESPTFYMSRHNYEQVSAFDA